MTSMTIAQLWHYASVGNSNTRPANNLSRAEAITLAKHKHERRTIELAALAEAIFHES